MARFKPNDGPPRSRTVVKPRISVASASRAGQQVQVADVAWIAVPAWRASIVCQ